MSGLSVRQTTQAVKRPAAFNFDTCIILHNPVSTNARRALGRIQQLAALFPEGATTILETSDEGYDANVQLLLAQRKKMGSRTLLGIAGGDGTVNLVVDTLMHNPALTAEMRRSVILPLWGGNGNDLAHMLNGAPHRSSINHILKTGKHASFHPLECTITTDGTSTSHTTICYASFGASAFAAHRLENLRGGRPFFHTFGIARFLHELGMVLQAMIQAPRFSIEDRKTTRVIYDRLFINGARFAKVTGLPLRLTDDWFYHVTVEQKRISSVAFHIARLIQKRPGQYIVPGDQCISFVLREATWAQIDGEIIHLKAGSHVTVGLGKHPVYALSTLLGA